MKKKFPGWIFLILAAFACNIPTGAQPLSFDSPTQGVASPAPATTDGTAPTDAPAAVPPTQPGSLYPDGEIATSGGITFLIPNGMASDATAASTTEVELPFINSGGGDMPLHTKFTLNNYAIKEETLLKPTIIVFKANEFAEYSELTTQMISELYNLQYTDGQPLPQSLGGSALTAQIHGINFQNGKGVRYLNQIQQAPLPINNHDMFYYYQGITNDGQYFIEAILPVHAPFLAADSNLNAPVPADGIPFTMDNMEAYYEAVTQKLNSTGTFSFTPYLDHLDAMIASLQINGL